MTARNYAEVASNVELGASPKADDRRQPWSLRRRRWLFISLMAAAVVLAGAYGWLAFSRSDLILGIVALELLGVALLFVPSLRGLAAPVLVADDYGLRLHTADGWVGLLWNEIDSVSFARSGFLRLRQLQVYARDSSGPYLVACSVSVNAKPSEVEHQLAMRRSGVAY